MEAAHELPRRHGAARADPRTGSSGTKPRISPGRRFNQIGIYLLVGCLAIMVAALKFAGQLTKGVPYPDSSDPKKDLAAEGRFARRAFGTGWLLLIGFTLALVIPWESPLERAAMRGPRSRSPRWVRWRRVPSTPRPKSLPSLTRPTREQWLAQLAGLPGPRRERGSGNASGHRRRHAGDHRLEDPGAPLGFQLPDPLGGPHLPLRRIPRRRCEDLLL